MNTQTKQPITLDALRTRRDEILAFARLYGAYKVGVFGSAARIEATPDSAFDLLVSFSEDASLYEMSGLWQDSQESLQNKVDLITEDPSPRREHFLEHVLKEAITL